MELTGKEGTHKIENLKYIALVLLNAEHNKLAYALTDLFGFILKIFPFCKTKKANYNIRPKHYFERPFSQQKILV